MTPINKNFVPVKHTDLPVSADNLSPNDFTKLSEEELLADALIDENKNDYSAAIAKYVFLIDQGSVKAGQRCIAMLKAGCGFTQTFAYCEQADKEKSGAAALILGVMYQHGYG